MNSRAAIAKALLLLAFPLLFAPGTFAGDAAKDKQLLQGKWRGKFDVGEMELELTLVNEQWTLQVMNKKGFFFKGRFTLDPKAKLAAMDMKVEESGDMFEGDRRQNLQGKTALAIYELSGDTLKWCANEPGTSDRPTEFTTQGQAMFVTFKRVK